MCSVVGYVGKSYSKAFVLEGLSRLEYRGYDSAGFACLHPQNKQIVYVKAKGSLRNLIEKIDEYPIDGYLGIGHTRWATHGQACEGNAHPHFDCQKKISVVHNGIVENHHLLKEQLVNAGHVFHSDTDSEVIAHMFEALIATNSDCKTAMTHLVGKLDGAFAFVAMMQDNPDFMIVVRKRSPLCIGIGDNEMFIASDVQAFAGKTNNVLFLPDESFALVRKDMVELYNFSGKVIPITVQQVDLNVIAIGKKGHAHFMVKEIYEQKSAICETLEFLKSTSSTIWEQIGLSVEQVKNLQKISMIGCGTSWHAACIAKFFFEEVCMIPAQVFLASEFRYMHFFPEEKSLYIAISQSGETADTLEAMSMINSMNLTTTALTNVESSTMVREASGFLLTQAGPEVAVASTKAFSTQLTVLFWLANRLAFEKRIIDQKKMDLIQEDILVVSEVLENSIENYKLDIISNLSKKYANYTKAIFLGRHISYPFAQEAALKLKEISYIFSHAYPAGELKHGPLALVDKETPVFVFSHQDPVIYKKLVSNAFEAQSRKGHIIAFAFSGQDELINMADTAFVLPKVNPLLGPLAMSGLMQFLAYSIAKELKCDIDKPRNLAKSVTVE